MASAVPLDCPPATAPGACISATDPDWSRETRRRFAWQPSGAVLAAIRDYQRHHGRKGLHVAAARFAVFRHRLWSTIAGCDIPVNSHLGGGLLMPHPNGIVIHPDCIIGPNCLIFQQVTIGAGDDGVPTLGGHVDVGAGARIIGAITIGDHARIGANAVVVHDVPAGATAVGIPARIIRRSPI